MVYETQNRLRADNRLMNGLFQVTGANGVITLAGYVVSSDQRVAAVQDAWRVQGVRVVIDNLRLAPVPSPMVAAVAKPALSAPKGVAQAGSASQGKTSARHESPPAAPREAHSAGLGESGALLASASAVPQTPSPSPDNAPKVFAESAASFPLPVLAPSPSPLETVTVPYGTTLTVRLTETLSSDTNEKGDTFLGSLAAPVFAGDRIVIPEGAGVRGRVVEVENGGRFSGKSLLAVEITALGYNGSTYDLRSNRYAREGPSRNVRSAASIGGGAGLGAILGGIIGGGKGAAIGAIIGAGAGTGVQAAGRVPVVRLPAESMLSFRLQAAVNVVPASGLNRNPGADPKAPSDPFPDDYRPVLKRRPGGTGSQTAPSNQPPEPAS